MAGGKRILKGPVERGGGCLCLQAAVESWELLACVAGARLGRS